jgi:hypothetical protein
MRSTKVNRTGRGLIWLSVVVVVLTTIAAANLTLVYVLFAVDHPGSDFAGFLPVMAIGDVPFLLTACLLAWAIRSRPSEPAQLSRQFVGRLRMITGFGLPVMVLGGFWSGLGGAFLGVETSSSPGLALTLYQFTFLAALIADAIAVVVALTTRTASAT